jgi:hypothetical protein
VVASSAADWLALEGAGRMPRLAAADRALDAAELAPEAMGVARTG